MATTEHTYTFPLTHTHTHVHLYLSIYLPISISLSYCLCIFVTISIYLYLYLFPYPPTYLYIHPSVFFLSLAASLYIYLSESIKKSIKNVTTNAVTRIRVYTFPLTLRRGHSAKAMIYNNDQDSRETILQ